MLPVIALVGRPNVGKSTLFNCLTKSRDALVADFPGLTRDRQYGQGKLGKKPYIVIDTGGIEGKNEGIVAEMAEQSWLAAEEAHTVFFLVDAKAGCTAADEEIAIRLRRLNKPIQLVVNKTDDLDLQTVAIEFMHLGFGEPALIAAAHGRGVRELIDASLNDYQIEDSDGPTEQGIQFAIVGRPNVGKSTLVNRILGEERVVVYDQPGTTRDSIFIPFERHGKPYTVIDTAGVRRRGRIDEAIEKFSVVKTLQAIEAAHVIIAVIDAREGISEQDLRLLGYILDAGRAVIIAINKWDGLEDYKKQQLREEIERRLTFLDYAETRFISALHGTGVGDLFPLIERAYTAAMKKFTTHEITELLQRAVQQHQPPLRGGRRIKMRYAHQGGSNPPIIVIHGNQVDHVPHVYQRYLVNFFRDKLDLLGTPVHLQFKEGENPYKDIRKKLTPRQEYQRKRRQRIFKKK